jgi:hypothetical protein
LDPTLLKKKWKDNGETDALSAGEDIDGDEDIPPLLDHEKPGAPDNPNSSDSDNPDYLDSARPTSDNYVTDQRCQHLLASLDLLVLPHLDTGDDDNLG